MFIGSGRPGAPDPPTKAGVLRPPPSKGKPGPPGLATPPKSAISGSGEGFVLLLSEIKETPGPCDTFSSKNASKLTLMPSCEKTKLPSGGKRTGEPYRHSAGLPNVTQ